MYGDLYELLVPGFLSSTLELDGHRYGLRSLSQNDLLFLRKFSGDRDPAWRAHLVAHSVWMADGVPFLEDFGIAHRVVYDSLLRSSQTILREMLGTVLGFFSRMREAQYYLESYLYEEDSRRLWGGIGRGSHPLWSKASIPGVERLGLNSIQSAWTSWNQVEDSRLEQEYTWSNTKVLVSLQSHKGYESLNNKDRMRADTEDGRRISVKEKAYRRYQYGETVEDTDSLGSSSMRRARTNDELEDEMRRWIRGDLDEHDRIVEAYKNRIREEQEERERQKEEFLAELRAKREESDRVSEGITKPLLVPITPEEMAARQRAAPRTGARFITEADPVSRTFNRYLRTPVAAGALSVDESGKIVETAPPAKESIALDDRVASRRVVFDEG